MERRRKPMAAGGAALLTAGLLVAGPTSAQPTAAGQPSADRAAPGGTSAALRAARCQPEPGGGRTGVGVRLSEKGQRGVIRLRVRWSAHDLDAGTTVSQRRLSRAFRDTPAGHRFTVRHDFTLPPGRYRIDVTTTWVRAGQDWRRTTTAGTCDLRVPAGAPPSLLPVPPPDVAPPPEVAAAAPGRRLAPAAATGRSERVVTGVTTRGDCAVGRIRAFAPGVRTDRDEAVWWVPQLWRWDYATGSWTVHETSSWAWAGAVHGSIGTSGTLGMPVWFNYPDNAGVSWRAFSAMPSAHFYAVLSWFWTSSGGWQYQFADLDGGQIVCYVG